MEKNNSQMKIVQKIALITAFTATIAAPLWFAAGALGTKFGLWHFSFGLVKMTFIWGPKLLIGVTATCIVSFIIQLIFGSRQSAVLGIIPVIFSGAMLWYFISTVQKGVALPPIHDIQTDWDNPVSATENLVKFRKENGLNPIFENPVVPEAAKGTWPDMVGKSNAELQKKYYGFVAPKISKKSPKKLFKTALDTVKQQGWKIQEFKESEGFIHAEFTSPWYGFTDDILIRVSGVEGDGSRLDIRSVSRVGLSDLGANASRIKRFLEDLEKVTKE